MNWQINKLVKSLLQKDTLEQCSLQELEQFADRNPYFGAAQLLLTKKLQIEKHDRYEEQLQKTFLYFHNPLWVEQLLNETGNAQIFAPEIKEIINPEPVINEQLEIPVLIAEENIEPEPVVVEQLEIPVVIAEENIDPEQVVLEQIKIPVAIDEENIEPEPFFVERIEIPVVIAEENIDPEQVVLEQIEIPVAIDEENIEPEPFVEQIEIPVVIAEENKTSEPIVTNTEIQPEQLVEHVIQPSDFSAVTEDPSIEIPVLKIDPPDSNREDAQKAAHVFEPFYTVDYFASQGIKFKEEEKPTDKFSLQLKSFTDWLKTMKRLPVSAIAKTGEVHSVETALVEKKVAQMAEHSLEEREVLTEAMAEVWEKQGNMAKAIEVYSKLSLIYPSKSANFAAKIDDLKKTN